MGHKPRLLESANWINEFWRCTIERCPKHTYQIGAMTIRRMYPRVATSSNALSWPQKNEGDVAISVSASTGEWVEEYACGPLTTMGRKLQSTLRPSPEYCQTHNAQTTNAIHRVVVYYSSAGLEDCCRREPSLRMRNDVFLRIILFIVFST